MFPILVMKRLRNRLILHAVQNGQGFPGYEFAGADFANHLVCKLVVPMILSARKAPLVHPVRLIVSVGSKPEMVRPHTTRNITFMKDELSFRNLAKMQKPTSAMSQGPFVASTSIADSAITSAHHCTAPKPASLGFSDVLPKPAGERYGKTFVKKPLRGNMKLHFRPFCSRLSLLAGSRPTPLVGFPFCSGKGTVRQ